MLGDDAVLTNFAISAFAIATLLHVATHGSFLDLSDVCGLAPTKLIYVKRGLKQRQHRSHLPSGTSVNALVFVLALIVMLQVLPQAGQLGSSSLVEEQDTPVSNTVSTTDQIPASQLPQELDQAIRERDEATKLLAQAIKQRDEAVQRHNSADSIAKDRLRELEKLEEQRNTQALALETTQKQLSQLQSEIERLQNAHSDELEQLKRESQDAQKRLEAQLAEAVKQRDASEGKLRIADVATKGQFDDELRRIQSEEADKRRVLEDEIARLSVETKRINDQLAEAKKQVDKEYVPTAVHDVTVARRDELERELEALRQSVLQSDKEERGTIAHLKDQLVALKEQLNGTTAHANLLQAQLDAMTGDRDALDVQLRGVTIGKEAISTENADLKQAILVLHSKVDEARVQIDVLNNTVTDCGVENQELTAALQSLQQQWTETKQQLAFTQDALETANRKYADVSKYVLDVNAELNATQEHLTATIGEFFVCARFIKSCNLCRGAEAQRGGSKEPGVTVGRDQATDGISSEAA